MNERKGAGLRFHPLAWDMRVEVCYQAGTISTVSRMTKDSQERTKTRQRRVAAQPQGSPATGAPKGTERIAKAMARTGVASRRAAEAMILAGRVSVNGEVVTSPAFNVAPSDRISVDGRLLPQKQRTRLFLYHKPRGLLTTDADPQGRPTIFASLPKNLPRLISVGRLDLNTEGLLLLTNDGGVARALELPATGWLRRYRVRAFGDVTQERLDGLRRGIEVDGVRYGAIEAALDRRQGDNVWLTFAMREGKNREIRNVLGALGLRVNRLIRISYGPFQLGELEAGAVEEVKTRILRDQLGAKLTAASGADFTGPIGRADDADIRDTGSRSPRRTAPPQTSTNGVPAAKRSKPAPRQTSKTDNPDRRSGRFPKSPTGLKSRRQARRAPDRGRRAKPRSSGPRTM